MVRKLTGRRRPDRAQNADVYWAARIAKASGTAERAAIEWDRLRVELSHLPEGERASRWSELAERLSSWRQRLTDSDIHAGDSQRDSRR